MTRKPLTLERQFNVEIGRRITAVRADKGYTCAEFAAAMGVAAYTMSRYETGRNTVSIFTLDQMAAKLDISLRTLVPRNGRHVL